jgi:ElaB/YqjD/DUF883 family membrane-anchored ribosome-binding protein
MFLNESESKEYNKIDVDPTLAGALDIIYETDQTLFSIENAMVIAEHRAVVTEDINLNEAASDFFKKIMDTLKKFAQKVRNWIEKYFRKAMDRFNQYSKWYEKNKEYITTDVSVEVNTYSTLGIDEYKNILRGLGEVVGQEREGVITQRELKEEIFGGEVESIRDEIYNRVFGEEEQKKRKTSPGLIKEASVNVQKAEEELKDFREMSSVVRDSLEKAVEKAEEGLSEAKSKDDVQDSELSLLRQQVKNRQTESKVAYTVYTQLITARSKSASESLKVLKAVVKESKKNSDK